MNSPTITAVVITPDGQATDVELPADTDRNTLRALYNAIGCSTVDVIHATQDVDVWLDDEALLMEHPRHNPIASLVAVHLGSGGVNIHGTAVFTASAADQDDIQPMSAALRHRLHGCVELARHLLARAHDTSPSPHAQQEPTTPPS